MKKIISFIAESPITQIIITLTVYTLYAAVMGISLVPSVYLVIFGVRQFLLLTITITNVLLFCFTLGLSVYLYFITGVIVSKKANNKRRNIATPRNLIFLYR